MHKPRKVIVKHRYKIEPSSSFIPFSGVNGIGHKFDCITAFYIKQIAKDYQNNQAADQNRDFQKFLPP